MRRLDEVFILQRGNARLPSLLVHRFQLGNCILLHLTLNGFNDLLVVRQVRTVSLQTNHVQRGSSLQRTMYMIEFTRVLGLVQIRRHATISIRLGSQQIGIWNHQHRARAPLTIEKHSPFSLDLTAGSNLDSPSILAMYA